MAMTDEERRERRHQYYIEHKAERVAYSKQYYDTHRELRKEYQRNYGNRPEIRKRRQEYMREYYLRNKERKCKECPYYTQANDIADERK